MTEGLGAFRDAISNLERAAGGGSLDPSHYEDSSTPELGENRFLDANGFTWNAEGQAVDPVDEASQVAYWADNREGIGAVSYDPDDDWDF